MSLFHGQDAGPPFHQFVAPRRQSIVGYHGTSIGSARAALSKGFKASMGPGEWLGHGVYFWEGAAEAWLWAERSHSKKGAVIEATLVLGYCFDLDNQDPPGEFIQAVHSQLLLELERAGQAIPENIGDQHNLNCAILNKAASFTYPPVDSVIHTPQSGRPVVEGTGWYDRTRRQICMRNINNILNPVLLTDRL